MILAWERPPEYVVDRSRKGGRPRGRAYYAAELLKTRPHCWALIAEGLSYDQKNALNGALYKHGCRCRTEKQLNGSGWKLWAIYEKAG